MEPLRIGPSMLPVVESDVSVSTAAIKPDVSVAAEFPSSTASSKEGEVFQPSAGDEVLIAFESGEQRMAFLTGGLWNADTPPQSASPTSPESGTSGGDPAAGGAQEPAAKDNRVLDERVKLIVHHLEP